MYTPDEIVTLGRAYGAAMGWKGLSSVSKRACGTTDTLSRIDQGLGCHTRTLARATAWFDANWPPDLAWPLDDLRRSG